ncbi:hypothetical protein ACFHYQ_05915 [Sphaerimonospora cavernae]|uniref:Uncharacterized protein n=1 Tax=Sphaerimonospora cavernae TaxID=1740611 RepID=A0ABV6U3V4_9ACTN
MRLMMAAAEDLRSVFDKLLQEERIHDVVAEGCRLLRGQFGFPRAPGVEMAARALAGDLDERRVRLFAPAFVEAQIP